MAHRKFLFALALGLIPLFLCLDPPRPRPAGASSNFPPTRKTGAPITGQGTCGDCHGTGADNSGDGSLVITAPDNYVPGQAYTITATLQDPGMVRWGFELTVLKNSDLTMAGALSNPTTLTNTAVSSGITYIGQITGTGGDGTFDGTADGPVSWSIGWTAPSTGSGAVTFYAAGVAANGNGNQDDADFTYVASKAVTEQVSSAVLPTTWGMIKSRYR